MKTTVKPAFPASVGVVVNGAERFKVIVITILRLVVECDLIDGEW